MHAKTDGLQHRMTPATWGLLALLGLIWGGIHFRTADVQGTVIGKKVAHWIRMHHFATAD